MNSALCELDIDHAFTDDERDALAHALADVHLSPYKFYEAFRRQVRIALDGGALPDSFVDLCERLRSRDREQRPVVLLRNVPIDRDVPVFDADDPVHSKYRLKTTFVAEAFLEAFAVLTGVAGIGNLDIADGDVFNDIYPKRSAWNTYSSKGLLSQPFHKDLGSQPVVPDYIHMLAMRSTLDNEVYTSFVRSVDILGDLAPDEVELLRQELFYTVTDPATSYDTGGVFPTHAVLSGSANLRFTEGRTHGRTDAAEALARRLDKLPHLHKKRVHLMPGDLAVVCNHLALHAREVGTVRDQETLRVRWIIKSANLDDLGRYQSHLVLGTDYLVVDQVA